MNLEIARKVAEEAHKGQKRKGGEDYINHVIRVSQKASEYSKEAGIIGMLHDVLEDSNLTAQDLQNYGFSENVITGVICLTKPKNCSYLNYILSINNLKELNWGYNCIIYVKICDLKDNLIGATGTLKDKYELALWILENNS